MPYNNPLMIELMVPRDPRVGRRIVGFFEAIGWEVRPHSQSEFDTYAAPQIAASPRPTIAYWQTENPGKIAQFEENDAPIPSKFARGLRLPQLFDLVEICLIVPSDDEVHAIFVQGGQLLEDHTHVLPHEHAGVQEFRFSDPFHYALRVTADPGYEVNVPLVNQPIE